MGSRFYLGSGSQSVSSTPAYSPRNSTDYDSDDQDDLPFPAELARKDFLAPNFDAQSYLSSLRNRHQTLEDLRSDLRQRTQLLNKELLDLVNANYEEFLRLGGDLKGGEEKVEGLRVGMLEFEREINGIRKNVLVRLEEVKTLVQEKKDVRKEVITGRALLEVSECVSEMEESLGVRDVEGGLDDADLDDENEDEEANPDIAGIPIGKLRRHTTQYVLLTRQMERSGLDHPFIQTLRPRIDQIRNALLLDLASALRQAKAAKSSDAILAITTFYRDLNVEREGLRMLKSG